MTWFRNALEGHSRKVVDQLARQVAACATGVKALVEFIREPSGMAAKVVTEAGTVGQEELEALLKELRRSSVVPVDRAGVLAIARASDKVLHIACRIVAEAQLFGLGPNPVLAQEALQLQGAVESLREATEGLRLRGRLEAEGGTRRESDVAEEALQQDSRTAAILARPNDSIDGLMETLKLLEIQRQLRAAEARIESARRAMAEMASSVQ